MVLLIFGGSEGWMLFGYSVQFECPNYKDDKEMYDIKFLFLE